MTVVDNTDGLPGMLESIMSAIEDGVASILAAISGLQTNVDDGLHAIDEDLMAIDADLQAIHTDLSNVDTDLQAVHGDLEMIDADLMAIDEDLMDVNAGMTDIDDKLMTVNDNLGMMDGKITELTQTVNTLGQASTAIAGLADANAATQEGVQANAALINEIKEQLMQVSEAVGVVQEQTAEDEEAEKTSAVGSTLSSADKKFPVLVNAFSQNKATDASYTTTLTFSCKEHVFLNMAQVDSPTAAFTGDSDSAIVITADGLNVYNTEFKTTTGTGETVYSAGASFNLKPLAAGSEIAIKISTDKKTEDLSTTASENRTFTLEEYLKVSNRGLVIDGDSSGNDGDKTLTKADAGKKEALKIDMSWYSGAADAGCTLTSPASPAVDYTEVGETASSSLTAMSGQDRTIKQITGTVFTCTENTSITKVSLEGLLDGFESFVKLKIITDKEKSLKFEKPFMADLSNNPIEFTAGEFTVNGTIPANAALITITDDTVKDGSCSPKS